MEYSSGWYCDCQILQSRKTTLLVRGSNSPYWVYKHSWTVIRSDNVYGPGYFIFWAILTANALNMFSTFWPVFALVRNAFALYFAARSFKSCSLTTLSFSRSALFPAKTMGTSPATSVRALIQYLSSSRVSLFVRSQTAMAPWA